MSPIKVNYFSNFFFATKNDCAIIVSYSGTTKRVVDAMSILNRQDIPTILITGLGNNDITEKASHVIHMTTRERLSSKIGNFTTEVSVHLILDILYSCYFAEKVFIAVKRWLKERLKLEISEEKSKVVNLKRHYSEFLGFELKAVKKRKKYVVRSHMTEKAKIREKKKLVEQIKNIAHTKNREDEAKEITLYNSMVMGIHNYYCIATMISSDCKILHRNVSIVMKNRLRKRLSKKGKINEVYIRKQYGKSKQIRFISSKTICPIGYIQTKTPMFKKKKICKYTPEGREEIHKNLKINTRTMLELMRVKDKRRSIEYMDNRISLFAAQYGRCNVTGKELSINEIHCHHKVPIKLGGTDEYSNLVILHQDIHILIHSTDIETQNTYLKLINPDKKALNKINELRLLVGNSKL